MGSMVQAELNGHDRVKEDVIATRRKVGDIRTAKMEHVDVEMAQRGWIPRAGMTFPQGAARGSRVRKRGRIKKKIKLPGTVVREAVCRIPLHRSPGSWR